MTRFIIITTSILLLITALVYTLLFTSMGNNILRPVIQAKINENSPIKVKRETEQKKFDKREKIKGI
jgi:amino acid permease